MSGAQEAILTLAKTLSGAGEDEEPLLEALCQAAEQTRRALESYDLPEVRYFIDTFLESFSLSLDELK